MSERHTAAADTAAAAASRVAVLPGENRAARRALLVCLAAGITTLLDQSVLNIAVPVLGRSLEATPAHVQWIIAGYSLTFGLAFVPGGSLGDVHGRKGLFLIGLSSFVMCGVVAATATHPDVVVAARLVQGAGAGLVNSQVIGTIQDVFRGLDRARALGLYAVTGGVATAVGPTLGGVLVGTCGPGLGWRLCLLLSAPCGVLTLWFAGRWLPASRSSTGRNGLDWWGLVWAGALTLALMLPFIRTPDDGRGAALWAGAAFVAAVVFVVEQRYRVRAGRRPLVHPSLARSAPYALGTVVAMAQFGSSLAAGLVLTMFLQDGLGLSALVAAAVSLPAAVAMGVTSAVAWRVVRRLGAHTVTVGLVLGVLALLAGAAATVTVPLAALPFVLAAVQLCSGAASGLSISPNQAQVLQHAPAEAAGVAGGILQMAQRIAAAISLSAVSGIYLRGGSHATDAPRVAYAQATLVCAGMLVVALAVSLVRSHGADRGHPRPHTATGDPGAGPAARPLRETS
ncbi:MFS transporter [Streptomyces sp. NPDC002896]|uniref:MFS transporter n=1 Tax=Streptomyces sp. NPDC002896 TaxID=3154438 RepID=UPI00332AFFE1